MTFQVARSIAEHSLDRIGHIYEYRDAWVFFGVANGNKEISYDNDIVIMKDTGLTLTYALYVIQHIDTDDSPTVIQ